MDAARETSACPDTVGSLLASGKIRKSRQELNPQLLAVATYVGAVTEQHAKFSSDARRSERVLPLLPYLSADARKLEQYSSRLARLCEPAAAQANLSDFNRSWVHEIANPLSVCAKPYARLFEAFSAGRFSGEERLTRYLDPDTDRGRFFAGLLSLSPIVGAAALVLTQDFESSDSTLHDAQRLADPRCASRGWYLELLKRVTVLHGKAAACFDDIAATCEGKSAALALIEAWRCDIASICCDIVNAATVSAAARPSCVHDRSRLVYWPRFSSSSPLDGAVQQKLWALVPESFQNSCADQDWESRNLPILPVRVSPFDLAQFANFLCRFFSRTESALEYLGERLLDRGRSDKEVFIFDDLEMLCRANAWIADHERGNTGPTSAQARVSLMYPYDQLSDDGMHAGFSIRADCTRDGTCLDVGAVEFERALDYVVARQKCPQASYSETVDEEGSLLRVRGTAITPEERKDRSFTRYKEEELNLKAETLLTRGEKASLIYAAIASASPRRGQFRSLSYHFRGEMAARITKEKFCRAVAELTEAFSARCES